MHRPLKYRPTDPATNTSQLCFVRIVEFGREASGVMPRRCSSSSLLPPSSSVAYARHRRFQLCWHSPPQLPSLSMSYLEPRTKHLGEGLAGRRSM